MSLCIFRDQNLVYTSSWNLTDLSRNTESRRFLIRSPALKQGVNIYKIRIKLDRQFFAIYFALPEADSGRIIS